MKCFYRPICEKEWKKGQIEWYELAEFECVKIGEDVVNQPTFCFQQDSLFVSGFVQLSDMTFLQQDYVVVFKKKDKTK